MYFLLYGTNITEVEYILDSYRILRDKDQERHGEYRTKRVVLEIFDEMSQAMQTRQPYQTRLNPPPGDPRAAHQT
jgi:hypothetical protein